jgi:hypothetical protein
MCEPTASQKAAEVQDTPVRLFVTAPAGDTACWSCQELPFQDSARATDPPALVSWELPAASHAVTATHDTWLRPVTDAIAGFGVVCRAQEVPFQVTPKLKALPELSKYWPTASQNDVVTQDTPVRLANVELAGLGIVCALQDDPFHTSPPPAPATSQKVAETHDTVPRPTLLGRFSVRHAVPFHRSANVPVPMESPTATQNVVETHDTAVSRTSVLPGGPGTRCSRHEDPFHCAARAAAWFVLF